MSDQVARFSDRFFEVENCKRLEILLVFGCFQVTEKSLILERFLERFLDLFFNDFLIDFLMVLRSILERFLDRCLIVFLR